MQHNIGLWVKNWASKDKIQCVYLDSTTSTNDVAKNYSFTLQEPVVFVAETQTQGRGRNQNKWLNTTPGAYLLSTWSYALNEAPQPITTPLVGLAVYWAISAAFQIADLNLKAPNDIYIGDKKVGGLLVEVVTEGNSHRLHIGFGLNIFEAPKISTATFLQAHCHEAITEEVFHSFLENLNIGFGQVVNDCHETMLSEASRNELLEALNKNPIIEKPFVEVEADGSLRTADSVIDWHSL